MVTVAFTGKAGRTVELDDTLSGCRAILDGETDDWAESSLYMVGDLDEARERERAGATEAPHEAHRRPPRSRSSRKPTMSPICAPKTTAALSASCRATPIFSPRLAVSVVSLARPARRRTSSRGARRHARSARRRRRSRSRPAKRSPVTICTGSRPKCWRRSSTATKQSLRRAPTRSGFISPPSIKSTAFSNPSAPRHCRACRGGIANDGLEQ